MTGSNATKYPRLATPHHFEVEMPFLLPELMDIGLRLPRELQLDGHEAKPLLKELCARYFPREWVFAPKLGFPSPLAAWLRGPLARGLAMLHEERARCRGLYRLDAIGKLDSRAGRGNSPGRPLGWRCFPPNSWMETARMQSEAQSPPLLLAAPNRRISRPSAEGYGTYLSLQGLRRNDGP